MVANGTERDISNWLVRHADSSTLLALYNRSVLAEAGTELGSLFETNASGSEREVRHFCGIPPEFDCVASRGRRQYACHTKQREVVT